jgi:cholesterol transport system auxiliary component
MMSKSIFLYPLLGVVLLSAGGCIRLLPKPPPPPLLYPLEAAPESDQSAAAMPKNVVISVAEPDAPRSLDGSDIAWRKEGALAYVDGVSWEGNDLTLLQTLLVHTIDRRGEVRGAVRSGEGSANVQLRWDLIAFEVEEDGALEARLQTNVKLFDARTRRLIVQREFDERAPLANRSSAAAARALQAVARSAAAKISQWAALESPEQDAVSWPPASAQTPLEAAPAPPAH